MKLLTIVTLSCCLLALNAKIDNKFAPKYEQRRQQGNVERQTNVAAEQGNEILNASETPDGEVSLSVTEEDVYDEKHHKHGHHGHKKHEKNGHHGNHIHSEDTDKESNHGHQNKVANGPQDRQDANIVKWKKLKPVSQGKDTTARKVWKKITNYKHSDSDKCDELKCKRKHVCLVNADTGDAKCVRKKLLRQRRKLKKAAKKAGNVNNKDFEKKINAPGKDDRMSKKDAEDNHHKAHTKARLIKEKAEVFKEHYQEKRRRHLHNIKDVSVHKEPEKIILTSRAKKSEGRNIVDLPQNDAPAVAHCSSKDLSLMGTRLLDWFKLYQDKESALGIHLIQKRNSKKKELHEQDECICQAPVRWEFLKLDRNKDNSVSTDELKGLETNGYEHCLVPFMRMCDHDHDGELTNREWCCCFAGILPPCLAELKKVPVALTLGQPAAIVPGAFVPQCETDGFYKQVQCHGSTGYCWCVDRNGFKLEGTDTRGTPSCVVEKIPFFER